MCVGGGGGGKGRGAVVGGLKKEGKEQGKGRREIQTMERKKEQS